MADRFPLIVDSATGTVKELPSGDNLNLNGSSIVNAIFTGVTTFSNSTNSTSFSTGAVLVTGGVGIGSTLSVQGGIFIGSQGDQRFFISEGPKLTDDQVANQFVNIGGLKCNNIHIGDSFIGFGTTAFGHRNIAIGRSSMTRYTSGAQNVSLGFAALGQNTTGGGCIAIGCETLAQHESGIQNIAVGNAVMRNLISGSDNVGMGHATMASLTTGSNNTAFGGDIAPYVGLGSAINCSFFGYHSAVNQSGSNSNSYFGMDTGHINSTGFQNTLMGNTAGFTNTDHANTAIGFQAMYAKGAGTKNVALGMNSLYNAVSGDNNTAIGAESAINATTGSSNVSIGKSSSLSTATVSNEVNIFNGSVTARFQGAASAWTFVSDARDKTNIKSLDLGLSFINEVKPRSFDWNIRDSEVDLGKKDIGFIAQELLEVIEAYNAQQLNLVDTKDPNRYMIASTALIPVLVKSIQELNTKNEKLEERISYLESI